MKNKFSIKLRVTLWYAFFMILLMFVFILIVSNVSANLTNSNTESNLKSVTNDVFEELEVVDDRLIVDDLDFFEDGVYISVYNKNLDLLYGRTPSALEQEVTFKSDTVQIVETENDQWFIYDNDMKVKGAESEVWVRGITSRNKAEQVTGAIFKASMLIFPIITIFAIAVGYLIAKSAFAPVKKIQFTAQQIGESNDLSRRINLSDGRDEIHSLAHTFDNMFEKLEQAFKREQQFTADASHELRTPISVIKLESEYALKDKNNSIEATKHFENIAMQTNKMETIIYQMLNIARVENKNNNLIIETVNLADVAHAVVGSLENEALLKEIKVTVNAPKSISIEADETTMIRLFTNLISNAICYGVENGFVTVDLADYGDYIVGTVEDNGIGISKINIDKIWDRFYQEESSHSNNSNSGLGLTMVKQIINAHNGAVSVESQLGEGSKFIFNLPKKHKL